MNRFVRLSAVLFLILAVSFAPSLFAQSDRGAISGHITDSTGSLLQGAQVQIQPTGASVVTNQQGEYFLNNLAPGSYTITVTYIGFATFTKTVNVTAGQPGIVDIK